jgi:hypothetical protein
MPHSTPFVHSDWDYLYQDVIYPRASAQINLREYNPYVYIEPHCLRVSYVYELRKEDILCGRGAPTNWQPGNHFLCDIAEKYQCKYMLARRTDKPEIANQIVQMVRDRGGRFLKPVKTGDAKSKITCWQEISAERSYEKVCQHLRDCTRKQKKLAVEGLTSLKST